ncbi:uncharacterized protein B0I36DRAFT_347478 [Microdochium trichocladiopsis]|uniref:GYF domain-containing protein n=1 Tax=Microdochium trichocladiopsis TaxID=1682393 RepID=A0A9P9BTA2_9PEZI|nr:uncharacterized protein B0I36DRAFT_347478 [Microdochium trichocladiopsis]KAH7035745.1 hypothetical protein B0I36DRAFT_347478 [Microdochium trichocladiopsis]
MPSNLPSSFASAAAGQNAGRENKHGARGDGRGSNSGEWSRPGRSTNGTLTFRRTSTTPSTQNQQLQSSDIMTASGDSAVISAMAAGSSGTGSMRYSREDLLDITANIPQVSSLFAPGWQPGQLNGSAGRGWGKTAESHPAPQEPDVCWDNSGSVRPVAAAGMTSEEKELFSSDVNSVLKPPVQNKDGNHPGGGQNGRKTSVSQGGTNNFGIASPSSSRPGTRRRETTDTNPYSGGGGLVSPTSATRPSRDDWSFARRTTDLRESTFDEAAAEGPQDTGNKPNPFGSLLRQNTTPALGNAASQSPWGPTQPSQASNVPSLSGIGSFGNFAIPSSAIGDKRPSNTRGESRLAHLIPKDNNTDNAGTKQNESGGVGAPDLGRSWRARPRTDTDPFGTDENLSGSAVLGGAQDTSPPPVGTMRSQVYDTPVKGSAGDFGMSGLNLGSHGDQDNAPLSPSETNPFRSPHGDRGEHDDTNDKPQSFAALPEHLQGFGHRPFGQGGFDGSDRSQTSSVGAKAYPPLGNLTAWPSSGTPDRERGGAFPGFGGSLFGTVGDIQSPSLGNLGSVFGPASSTGLAGSGSISRGSKLGSLFPPAMQAQMQSQDHDSLSDSIPDLRHANPLGAIGRNPIGDHRETESPLRTNRGIFADMFSPPEGTRTPSSDPLLGGLPSTSQTFTPTSGAPPFAAPPSSDPPSAQARTMVMPDRMRWVYLDPQGQQQGPFTGLEMNDWYKAQFFTPNLRVKKLEDPEFEPLGQLIRRIGNSREPFLVPQIGIPHGPPTQSGPFSPGAGGVIQPPLVGAFPSFGRTLTAEEQNNLERRKQEEQYLMARQREFLSNQQSMSRVQMQSVPGLQHHSSAHSLQSQPSFGSITSPGGLHPQAPIGAIGSSSFFGEQGAPQAAASSSSGPNFGMFREEDLARLSDQDRQMLTSLQGPGNASGQQPIGAPPADVGVRGQLPGTDDLVEDEEGFRGRLQEFEQLRAERDAQQASHEQFGNATDSLNSHDVEESGANNEAHSAPETDEATQQHDDQRNEATEAAQRQYQQAQAATVAAKLSGLPMPFPPPQSGSPLPAPAPQRVKSNLPEQYATGSRSATPDVAPSSATTQAPSLAPWAKDNGTESHKGPSLKDIQAAEAAKAAKAEEQAILARQAVLKQEAAREREKAAAVAPGLPTTSTWGTASPLSAGPTGSPWAKPTTVKGPAAGASVASPAADKKKTLAEIQREEEARKLRAEKAAAATQVATAAAAGKRYADLASKPNAIPLAANAVAAAAANVVPAGWATVGANGKAKVPVAPAAQPRAVSTGIAKPAVAAPPKPTLKSNTSSLGSARSEAAEEFNKWLVGQCKRGITGVDAQVFAGILAELPLDAALIADAVYANSQTIDGRWFAQEFIRRKKLADKGVVEKQPTNSPDAQSGTGWSEVAKKSSHKEVTDDNSAAVTSAPGFKVVPALAMARPMSGNRLDKCGELARAVLSDLYVYNHAVLQQKISGTSPVSMAAAPAPGGKQSPLDIQNIERSLEGVSYTAPLLTDAGKSLSRQFVRHVLASAAGSSSPGQPLHEAQKIGREEAIRVGLAALGAFLQANVTGPVLEKSSTIEATFANLFREARAEDSGAPSDGSDSFIAVCLHWLDTDGVSVYQYIPHIELFGLARYIFTSGEVLPLESVDVWAAGEDDDLASHLAWTRFRVHLWHYKLLTQPSLSAGSVFTKSGRWTDVGTLQEKIESSMQEAENSLVRTTASTEEADDGAEREYLWSQESRVQFYLEKANCHIMLGNDVKAREALKTATEISKFAYVLSGALGKRTRFQENNISQLVVLAKSREAAGSDSAVGQPAPEALALNDDTLLEQIKFSGDQPMHADSNASESIIPSQLRGITPENQPKLLPEDQIILLAEATIRDTFSPGDSLTAEEVLPFAVRVIEDKSTNWQIYTQALLVRSRIELARSRTVERGVLQMQAVVDQVVVDTEAPAATPDSKSPEDAQASGEDVPAVIVTSSDVQGGANSVNKPTSFLPAAKPTESASSQERLRFVNALSSPPRWHLECELAYAWTSVGSLVSAMEIFKRLRLWPEIALCLATQGNLDDEDGRGSGGEEKARALLRWRLFRRTGSSDAGNYNEQDDRLEDVKFDISTLRAADWYGPARSPPPPNAPRLLCILGDIENDPSHFEQAWEISKKRYARAQKSLGELCLQRQDYKGALEAYRLAVHVNRVSNELWSRVGDLELRLGNFPDAAEAFTRAISTATNATGGDDARTWSNLGSALLSWYREVVAENRGDKAAAVLANGDSDDENDVDGENGQSNQQKLDAVLADKPSTRRAAELGKPAYKLLQESLSAFKRGATLAHSNWRIWDNVVTLAASIVPKPNLDDVILGVRNVLQIRKTEEALDMSILTLLLREITSNTPPAPTDDATPYTPARGTIEHKVVSLFEDNIVPLLTTRAEIWSLISRLRAWKRDYAGAMDASEKSWRAAIGGVGMGASLSAATTAPGDANKGNWLTDAEQWDAVVTRTEELVAAYENYGSRTEEIGPRWKGKARSAVRSVMGKARENWEGNERWKVLEGLMEELKL